MRNGFTGTYDQWMGHLYGSRRKHGGKHVAPANDLFQPALAASGWTEYISLAGSLVTLTLAKALDSDQFFHFCPRPGFPAKIIRVVLVNGQKIGSAQISLPAGENEQLCPYFDPVTRTLRFRKRDGQDAPYSKELWHLAQRKEYQPLLYLAHAEGLIDSIPGMCGGRKTSSC